MAIIAQEFSRIAMAKTGEDLNSINTRGNADIGPRIGVTGHRLDVLDGNHVGELTAVVRNLLIAVKQATSNPPSLVSSLAEGADQIVAEVGLDLDYKLICPLPFSRDEYANDFQDPIALARFRELVSRAAEVQELPGLRTSDRSEQLAYAAAGERVLEESELLIAVWNGGAARGPGGTAEIVAKAAAAGIPTVWISASPPHAIQLLEPTAAMSEHIKPATRAIEEHIQCREI
jgi:hypothetical protein